MRATAYLRYFVIVAEPRLAGPPARAHDRREQLMLPTGQNVHLPEDVSPVVQLQVERVVALHRMNESVHGGFLRVFRLESAEDEVPEDEDAAVVLIYVFRIAT